MSLNIFLHQEQSNYSMTSHIKRLTRNTSDVNAANYICILGALYVCVFVWEGGGLENFMGGVSESCMHPLHIEMDVMNGKIMVNNSFSQ